MTRDGLPPTADETAEGAELRTVAQNIVSHEMGRHLRLSEVAAQALKAQS